MKSFSRAHRVSCLVSIEHFDSYALSCCDSHRSRPHSINVTPASMILVALNSGRNHAWRKYSSRLPILPSVIFGYLDPQCFGVVECQSSCHVTSFWMEIVEPPILRLVLSHDLKGIVQFPTSWESRMSGTYLVISRVPQQIAVVLVIPQCRELCAAGCVDVCISAFGPPPRSGDSL